jgi:uncharacterized protein (TIGR03435 family)
MVVRPLSNGGYSARKVPVLALLTSAYGLSPDRIVGAPSWPDRYDIEARYESTDPAAPPPSLTTLLQSLLHDRFGLVAHMQMRELPAYLLKRARSDGRLGPGLHRSPLETLDTAGTVENPEAFVAKGTTMDVLAKAMRVPAGRPVINATGLNGAWDVTLEFSPLGDTAGDRPPVFTALQEQLGLKLDAATAPLEVLVVDSISRPTPN